jgi:hypothetical protein
MATENTKATKVNRLVIFVSPWLNLSGFVA